MQRMTTRRPDEPLEARAWELGTHFEDSALRRRFYVLGLLRLADRAGRERDRPTFVPREWVTEFHAAPAGHDSELIT